MDSSLLVSRRQPDGSHAVVVSPIHSAKLPAMQSAVKRFAEAIPRATPRMCLNGVAPVLLKQPDCLQMSLPAVGWLHITTCDEPPGSFERSKAHGASIGCVVRDLVSRLHRGTLRVSRKREGVLRESRLSPLGRLRRVRFALACGTVLRDYIRTRSRFCLTPSVGSSRASQGSRGSALFVYKLKNQSKTFFSRVNTK